MWNFKLQNVHNYAQKLQFILGAFIVANSLQINIKYDIILELRRFWFMNV